jgi:hypothetical protein
MSGKKGLTWLLQYATEATKGVNYVPLYSSARRKLTIRIVLHQPRWPLLPLDHLLLQRHLELPPLLLKRRRIPILPCPFILAHLVAHRRPRHHLNPRSPALHSRRPLVHLPFQIPRRHRLPNVRTDDVALGMNVAAVVGAEANVVRWEEEGGVDDCDPVEARKNLEGEVVLVAEAVGGVREYRRGKDPIAGGVFDVVEGSGKMKKVNAEVVSLAFTSRR